MSRSVLLSCEAVAMSYGTRRLFDDLSFGLLEGDRVGLVGPNGSGKSTLLKILAGLETPDRGTRSLRGGIRIGYVAQDPTFPSGGTIDEVMASAVGADDADGPGRVANALGRAGLASGHATIDTLSGGDRKRLAIARALIAEPDVLLLDEPTNHLDLDGILWLEELLREGARAFVVVSHDRYFLEHVTTRMLELNRAYPGGRFESDGPYSEFLARREDFLRGQAAWEDALANTVRREIAWLRRGAKARSTKAKGRIKAAEGLIEELAGARDRALTATAGIEFTASQRRTRKLLIARGITKSLGGRRLVSGLDLAITPGTRVGLIGPNGSGKSTLLGVLAGTLAADAGEIERADGLRVIRFDQAHDALDPTQSLRRALAPEGDSVTWQGRALHVAAWAKRFLFRPEQLDVVVSRLSGGEQARVRIARLMREPADLLILDEPSNDLDIPTLEVLEDSLVEFAGGLVLVTHDRFMLERVSTVIVALDGRGGTETFADYTQMAVRGKPRSGGEPSPSMTEAVRGKPRSGGEPSPSMTEAVRGKPRSGGEPSPSMTDDAARTSATPARAAPAPRPPAPERSEPRRLAYREQREWEGMEQAILEAERALDACQRAVDDQAIASDAAALQERYAAREAARAEVDRLYARWAELEAKQA
jgi:ABC transport system ATP-binding/permease protein